MKKYEVKIGAITKIVPESSLKWYLEARWKIIKEISEVKNANKTNTKKNASK